MKTEEINRLESNIDPIYGLQFLKSIHAGLPEYEDLKTEYFQDKYDVT